MSGLASGKLDTLEIPGVEVRNGSKINAVRYERGEISPRYKVETKTRWGWRECPGRAVCDHIVPVAAIKSVLAEKIEGKDYWEVYEAAVDDGMKGFDAPSYVEGLTVANQVEASWMSGGGRANGKVGKAEVQRIRAGTYTDVRVPASKLWCWLGATFDRAVDNPLNLMYWPATTGDSAANVDERSGDHTAGDLGGLKYVLNDQPVAGKSEEVKPDIVTTMDGLYSAGRGTGVDRPLETEERQLSELRGAGWVPVNTYLSTSTKNLLVGTATRKVWFKKWKRDEHHGLAMGNYDEALAQFTSAAKSHALAMV